jgi:histidinol dehydrogenase
MLELLDLRTRRERLEPRHLEIDPTVADTVRGLIQRVRDEGDDALVDLARRFDGCDLRASGLAATPQEFARATELVPAPLRTALDELVQRITDLHRRQLPPEWWDEREGVRFGEIVRPLARAGCYVPGGRAFYPSSVAMTVVPAVVAGVGEIVVCTPASVDGTLPPAVLYAAERAGATHVVKTGGAQAIAAMTFGTETVPAVDRIVGPGNAYVTEAKRQLAGLVGIDGLAGPSELTVVADASADAALVAIDLVAQAEHDPGASTALVTTDEEFVESVEAALQAEVLRSPRREIVEQALTHNVAVLVSDEDRAADAVNDLAAEHLQILLADPRSFLAKVRNAGAIFLGPWTAVPFGDYGVASNHVLPTAGTARFASGLRAADFVTVTSVVETDEQAVPALAPGVTVIAHAEGLVGHARAVEVRAERARPAP